MISSINGAADQFLADLNRIQSATDRAERQLSSGLRVANPSDGPDQVSQILQLRAAMALTSQRQANLSLTQSEVAGSEQALESAVQVVEHAATLAAQGGTGTATLSDRQEIAGEASSLEEQLVGLANTSVGGRYIFSGDQDQSAAYALDAAQPNGVDRMLVASATRQAEDANGTGFSTSLTAQDIFDHRNADDTLAADNVFAAVHGLQVALRNNDQAGILDAGSALAKAGDYLNQKLAFYGTAQDRVTAASNQADQIVLQQKSQLSALQDADTTEAILELTQGRTAQQAALAARAQLPQTSLFDFLK